MDGTKLTIRDLDPHDHDALKEAAARSGRSLNRYVAELLHDRARVERNRSLFAAVAAQDGSDLPAVDSLAEVRAVRTERENRAPDRGPTA